MPTNPHYFANPGAGINWPFDEDTDTLLDKELAAELHECWHSWRQYVGLTEQYQYCEKCDVKQMNSGLGSSK